MHLPIMNEAYKSVGKLPKISKWAQWIYPLVITFFFQGLAFLLSQFREPIGITWYGFFWSMGIVFVLWFIGYRVNAWFVNHASWKMGFWQKVIRQFVLVTFIQITVFNLSFIGINYFENNYLNNDNPLSIAHVLMSTAFAFVICLMINSVQMGYQIVSARQQALLEAHQFKQESIAANLENLKQQIDPHFMFNNFSTLHGLIHEDVDKASDFLLKLSDVYRYVLSSLAKESHTLAEELTLIRPYTELLAIRYAKQIRIHIEIPEKLKSKNIVTMALQIPIENAIKHNRIDAQHPLSISIQTDHSSWIEVKNNLQLRSSQPISNGIGLENLEARCAYLTGRSVQILQSKQHFAIKIPIWS
ncbi:MAG: sensor histidine kinase [Flammeovirgaceae bacterium]